jgi:hypothetical protein
VSKKRETWTCDDCNATNPDSADFCEAPQHEGVERALRAEYRVRKLEKLVAELEVRQHSWSTTIEEFFEEYTEALYAYLVSNESSDSRLSDRRHPLDLAYTISSFNDVWVTIHEVKEGRRLDRKKKEN